jgi:MtN3 and saliva related transmembrane protein
MAELSPLIVNGFGVAASICSMASFVPQIVKIWREKDAEGVSVRMFGITVIGFALWSTYGFLSNAWPVAASNIINAILAGTILALKLKYDPKDAAS